MPKYTLHLMFEAVGDANALALAETLSHGKEWHLTDADDWSEEVSLVCNACGKESERCRIGDGHRYCKACAAGRLYPIAS